MLTHLESAQVDQIVSIYSDVRLYYKLKLHESFGCKSIVKQLSGPKLKRSSKPEVERQYAKMLKCDVTLELYHMVEYKSSSVKCFT